MIRIVTDSTCDLPKTLQPSPGDFATAYRDILASESGDCDQIISIHVTGKLSGTCQSAQRAAEDVKDEITVEVFDSLIGDNPINLGVMHAEIPQEAQALLTRAEAMFNCQESYVNDLGLGLAVQFGPGTLGIITYRV